MENIETWKKLLKNPGKPLKILGGKCINQLCEHVFKCLCKHVFKQVCKCVGKRVCKHVCKPV